STWPWVGRRVPRTAERKNKRSVFATKRNSTGPKADPFSSWSVVSRHYLADSLCCPPAPPNGGLKSTLSVLPRPHLQIPTWRWFQPFLPMGFCLSVAGDARRLGPTHLPASGCRC